MPLTCFVVMGFGKKIDLATGRELDLDKSYHSIIKPAVQAAGYQCIRADEVQQSGMIDVPMYKLLFEAELVVADLSTTNPNAIFELGVRHALKPRTTIIIAESKFTIPFDATHIAVRRYEHLGSSIDYDEAIRMQKVLTALIGAIQGNQDPDSPVYTILQNLNAPTMTKAAVIAAVASAAAAAAVAAVMPAAGGDATAERAQPAADSYAVKLQIARDAINQGDFSVAKSVLRGVYDEQTARGADGAPNLRGPSSFSSWRSRLTKPGRRTRKQEAQRRRWPAIRRLKYSSSSWTSIRPPIPRRWVCGARSKSDTRRLRLVSTAETAVCRGRGSGGRARFPDQARLLQRDEPCLPFQPARFAVVRRRAHRRQCLRRPGSQDGREDRRRPAGHAEIAEGRPGRSATARRGALLDCRDKGRVAGRARRSLRPGPHAGGVGQRARRLDGRHDAKPAGKASCAAGEGAIVRRSFAGSCRAAPGDPSGERLMRKRPRAPRPSGWPIRRKANSGVSGPCSKART